MSVQGLHQASSQPAVDAPKGKKLRLSCDGCLGAKVKCSKQRPICSRCASQDISCVYSESRRAGRRGVKWEAGKENPAEGLKPSLSNPPSSRNSISDQMEWDEDIWHQNFPNIDTGNVSAQGQPMMGQFDPHTSNMTSLDPIFQTTATPAQNTAMDMSTTIGPGFLNLPSPPSKHMDDWIREMDQSNIPRSYSMDSLSPGMTNSSLHSRVTPESSTFSDLGVSTDNNAVSCNCVCTLQEKLNTLNSTVPPFDQFIAVTKSAVSSMTHCLSCNCLPEVSAVMFLSLIITRLVQWHKQISNGDCQASKDIGVTMGALKVDREDEHQIKRMLIRSELIKIRSLIDHFRGRFDSYLLGTEKQVYEANVEFLENELNTTIDDI